MAKNKKENKTPKKEKKENKKLKYYIISLLAIIAVIALFYAYRDKIFYQDTAAAIVNGEVITLSDINAVYSSLPAQYKQLMTKEMILNQTINEVLLLQEAKKQGIATTEEEAEGILNTVIAQSMLSRSEFEDRLKQESLTINYVKDYYRKQITIFKLLNETIFSFIAVSDSAIENYYEQADLNVSFDEVKGQIKQILLAEKQEMAIGTYMNQLRAQAEIEILFGTQEKTGAITFKQTGDDICKESNKPVVILFSTTESQHGMWISETFDSIAGEYNEKIAAYHWELDTGDNMLTETIETGIPKAALDIFKKYSPKTAVPAFVFGCRYVRIGNGYEAENDLEAEEREFRIIIEKLLP